MEIIYSKAAAKTLESMDKASRNRICIGIMGLTQKPPLGDIRPMRGYFDGRYRLRIGKYRVVYRFCMEKQLEILHIMDIGSRGDIYK